MGTVAPFLLSHCHALSAPSRKPQFKTAFNMPGIPEDGLMIVEKSVIFRLEDKNMNAVVEEVGGRSAIGCQRISQCFQWPRICILTDQLVRVSRLYVTLHILTIREMFSFITVPRSVLNICILLVLCKICPCFCKSWLYV